MRNLRKKNFYEMSFYEMPFYECLSMKCPNALFRSPPKPPFWEAYMMEHQACCMTCPNVSIFSSYMIQAFSIIHGMLCLEYLVLTRYKHPAYCLTCYCYDIKFLHDTRIQHTAWHAIVRILSSYMIQAFSILHGMPLLGYQFLTWYKHPAYCMTCHC